MSFFQQAFDVNHVHRIYFTRSVFSQDNPLLNQVLDKGTPTKSRAKVLIAFDSGVAKSFPKLAQQAADYFAQAVPAAEKVGEPLILTGGEAAKNSRAVLEELYQAIEGHGMCRHSFLIAVGGGAFLDVAGFAAATAHRGVRLIRIPTTTLSQADNGVGVKNGINAFGKKNFIGTFSTPFAVINDTDFLTALPTEIRNDGFIEAIKVALIRDAPFFDEIERLIEDLIQFKRDAVERVIFRSAELHYLHITKSGDPFESLSARPLDFGHWSAHKLEQLSEFQISHGAAVAFGLALDTVYSQKLGKLSALDSDRIVKLSQNLGFAVFHPLMKQKNSDDSWAILAGLAEFREHLGGELTVTLLEQIGRGFEATEMRTDLIQAAILELELRQRSCA